MTNPRNIRGLYNSEEQTSIELTNPRNIRGLYNSEEQTSIELTNPRNTWVMQQRGTNINRIHN